MSRKHENQPESWEKDPVWDLLRQSSRVEARPSFASDVVRAARLQAEVQPWWKRFAMPLALGGLSTAATAALAIFLIVQQPDVADPGTPIAGGTPPASSSLEALDEVVRTEALLVAAENPSEFSDAELVALIGY
ncbi:MAG: hypothetical protein AAGI48_00765 [Verrucomicrobiota bacterium]